MYCAKACVQWRIVQKPVCSDVLWANLCAAVTYCGKTCVPQWCIVEKPVCSDVLWKNLCREWRIVETACVEWRMVEKSVRSDVLWKNLCAAEWCIVPPASETHAREFTGDRLLTERSQSERKINHPKNSKLRAGGAQQAVLANSLFRCTLGEPRVLPLCTLRCLNYTNNSFTVSQWRDFNLS